MAAERPPFERIALILQGGGALGSYQGGDYQLQTGATAANRISHSIASWRSDR
jgi:hypothetical protein